MVKTFLLPSQFLKLTSHYINYTSIIHSYTKITLTLKSSLAFSSSFSAPKYSPHRVLICSASDGLTITNILPSDPTPSTLTYYTLTTQWAHKHTNLPLTNWHLPRPPTMSTFPLNNKLNTLTHTNKIPVFRPCQPLI